jgi:hypothetical protein
MRVTLGIAAVAAFLLGWTVTARPESTQPTRGLDVKVTQNTVRLMPYQVFEITFQHEGKDHNPTWDVAIDVTFTSPSGKKVNVGGFFYGPSKPQGQGPGARGQGPESRSSIQHSALSIQHSALSIQHSAFSVPTPGPRPLAPGLWKARYAPSELGRWTFQYVFRNHQGQSAAGGGGFEVVRGRLHQKGWVRINPKNPFRFVFEDGSPYFPIGFQDGIFDNNHNGSCMDAASMEGPFRPDPEGRRPKPPPGALFARGPSMNPVNGDVQFGRHARAGFNLWRFSPNNFSIKVFTLDDVNWQEAALVDELARMTRKYDIRFFYGIFGFTRALNDRPDDEQGMAKVKRIIKYSVDRWGAYVDFWELLNEQKASQEWYRITTAYLKSIDPYHKPVATSWERPELEGIDVSAPHWYGNEDELSCDRVTAGRAERDKRFGKPVVYGEQGNSRGGEDRTAEGIGGVWDPGSARRMRVRCWTALFTEINFIFWETSYAKDGHYMNLWIGPEERQYVHALQDFAYRLDRDVKIADVPLSGPEADKVRAYGLRSDQRVAVYLHHFGCAECAAAIRAGSPGRHRWDHKRGEIGRLRVTVDVPRPTFGRCPAQGYWYRPRDAGIIQRFDVSAGRQTLIAPPFTIDLALLITPDGPPDVDHDGVPNDRDDDDDNDGVPDAQDAFPLEREEWADADADRIGDNFDADVNADGIADDRNRNGVPDNEESDPDGDGVPTANAVPWDAFPLDPQEWRDTDGDGIGDNADPDDDGDGYSDREERQAGTDPLDPLSFPGD